MATDKKQVEIPGRLHSVATEGVVAGANEILDDNKGKSQQEINASVDDSLQENKTDIANEVTRATNAENAIKGGSSKSIQNLDSRLSTVEAHDTISMDGGSVVVGTAEDFTNRTTAGDAKIPTVGAILNGADEEPTAGSENLVKSGGVYEELALGTVYDVSAKNPTAGPNNDGKFESLSALLSDANLNTLIPTAVRKGGMSIKFVQTSDNKYIQARCMADEFTTDTTQWAIADESVYVENPEFVYIKTDANNKILWAIKTDGGIYYGAGVPQQVIDYIEEKIAALSLDEYEDIVAFLNGLEKGDKTLQMLLNEKVDKEEGKSLIDAEYAEGVHYIESPEFAEIKLDAEERIVEATYKDGTKLLPAGVKVNGVAEYDGATVTTISNPEFVAIWLDSSDRILLGIRNDADILFGYGVPSQIKDYIDANIPESMQEIVAFIGEYLGSTTLQELLDKKVDGEYIENPEYIEAKLDSEDKVLEGIREDGTKVIGCDLQVLGSLDINGVIYSVVSNPEWLKAVVDVDNKIICGIKTDGRFYVGDVDFLDDIETIRARLEEIDIFSTVESPEFVDVKTDADDKIVEAIRNDGTKVLPAGVETPKANLEGATIENKTNPEYIEAKVDAEDRLIEGTKANGTKVIGSSIEVGNDLKVKGDVEVNGNVNYKNGIPQAIIDYVAANTGSGVSNIEYEDETGDMYATYDEADGVTNVYMEDNGDIYAEIEE